MALLGNSIIVINPHNRNLLDYKNDGNNTISTLLSSQRITT
jgi:hypothetical protein